MNENNVIVDAKIKTANTVSRLQRSVGDKRLLTSIMTEVLKSENVVMEMVGLTQNPVFPEIFPEFYMKNAYGESFINCQQNNKYHRYGVWKHSLVSVEMVCGEDKPFSDDQATILKWVMLLHDIGKSFVKEINVDGTESFVGHEAKSSEIAAYILGKFDFAQDQIRQMCLLIEYHDTFLNIDDVSYENMLLLFEKMDQDKDLLNMLFEVKEADAKAKNIHSYEIARKVIDGFLALSRDYFNDRYLQKGGVSKFENDQLLGKTDNLGYDPEAIMAATIADSHDYASSETHELMRDCISQMCMKKDIDLLYQPIFDLKSVKVWGYEGYSRNRAHSTLNITQIIDYAKEIDKFDKLQQSMFVNAIEKFALTDKKEVNRFFISIDMDSFSKYANKPRIYDMMDKTAVVVELKNYHKTDTRKLQATIDEIRKLGGKVLLNNFDGLVFKQQDLEKINVDYIKFDISIFGEFFANEKKYKFLEALITLCFVKEIKLIVSGIESYPVFSFLKSKGIQYMQGYFLAKPQKDIVLWGEDIYVLINGTNADNIEQPKYQSTIKDQGYNPNDPNSRSAGFLGSQPKEESPY